MAKKVKPVAGPKKKQTTVKPARNAGRHPRKRIAEPADALAAGLKKAARDNFTDDPTELRFTDTHEWVRLKDRTTIVVGITDFAQMRLSDITSVELPEPDDHRYEAREEISIIEAINASAAFHAPVAGTIAATNTDLLSRPELLNSDPYGSGWLIEMRPDNIEEIFSLMDLDEYEAHLPEDEEE